MTEANKTPAMNWIRGKATEAPDWSTDVEVNGVAYRSTVYTFKGTLPPKMVGQLTREPRNLANEDLLYESFRLGGQYRSDYGKCEYARYEWTSVEAA